MKSETPPGIISNGVVMGVPDSLGLIVILAELFLPHPQREPEELREKELKSVAEMSLILYSELPLKRTSWGVLWDAVSPTPSWP